MHWIDFVQQNSLLNIFQSLKMLKRRQTHLQNSVKGLLFDGFKRNRSVWFNVISLHFHVVLSSSHKASFPCSTVQPLLSAAALLILSSHCGSTPPTAVFFEWYQIQNLSASAHAFKGIHSSHSCRPWSTSCTPGGVLHPANASLVVHPPTADSSASCLINHEMNFSLQ